MTVPVYIIETAKYIHPHTGLVIDPDVIAVSALTKDLKPISPKQAALAVRGRWPALQDVEIKVSDMPARSAWGNVLIDGSPIPSNRINKERGRAGVRGNYLLRGWCDISYPEEFIAGDIT